MKCKSKYSLKMLGGVVGYTLGLVAMNHFHADQSPYKYWLILLPVLPLVYIATTVIWSVSEMDEMWRKIITEAMAFSGVATGFTCFSYLFLRDTGASEFHAEWAFYMMWAYYGIGAVLSYWRYR